MQRVLMAVAVVAVVMFGGNYYYGRQVEKHLDSATFVMRGMGGNFEYSDVSISLGGEIRVDDVRLSIPEQGEKLIVDRVVVRTGSVLGVHKLAMDFRKSRMPEQLGLSIEGMRVPMGGESYQQLSAMGSHGPSLAAAGCGDRAQFSDSDYSDMGYQGWVMMDTHLDYRLVNSGQWIDLEVKSITEDMHDVSVTLDFSLNAPSTDMAAVGLAMAGAQLNEVRMDYEDRGYAARVFEFCRQQAGLSRSDFLVHHLDAWQDAWRSTGFVAGENMVAAYRRFLEQPEHFSISARPMGEFSMMEMEDIAPELLLYQFQIAMEVNRVAAGRVDLAAMDQSAKQAWQVDAGHQEPSVEPKSEPSVEPKSGRRGTTGPRAIAVEDLHAHLNAHVVLRLTTGKTVEGRIRQLDKTTLQLQSYQSGGYITMPVDYVNIAEAQLK